MVKRGKGIGGMRIFMGSLRFSIHHKTFIFGKTVSMGAIIIKADSKSSKMLKELAEKLGGDVTTISDEQYEDVLLGALMDKEKTGKNTTRAAIFKKLDSR